jgi:hypothetical protein
MILITRSNSREDCTTGQPYLFVNHQGYWGIRRWRINGSTLWINDIGRGKLRQSSLMFHLTEEEYIEHVVLETI